MKIVYQSFNPNKTFAKGADLPVIISRIRFLEYADRGFFDTKEWSKLSVCTGDSQKYDHSQKNLRNRTPVILRLLDNE